EQMVMLDSSKRPFNHFIPEVSRVFKLCNPRCQCLRYPEMPGPPRYLLSFPDQSGSNPRDRFLLRSFRRQPVKVDTPGKVETSFNRGAYDGDQFNDGHRQIRS